MYGFLQNSFLQNLGIIDFGYTEVSQAQSFDKFQNWLNANRDQPLKYLSGEKADKRADCKNYFSHFQSALVFLFSYEDIKKELLKMNPKRKIASYALGFDGFDYHDTLRVRLDDIAKKISLEILDCQTRFVLDTQPVLERDLAYRAGLGWFGKNSMLISRNFGSYFIIGSLLLSKTLKLEARKTEIDHCGHCTACVDACPTKAIDPDTRTLITDKCISTYTIELFKEAPPPKGYPSNTGEIFGCDICQDVCPWNKKRLEKVEGHALSEKARELVVYLNKKSVNQEIKLLSHKQYKLKFKGTSLERLGKRGLLKNFQ